MNRYSNNKKYVASYEELLNSKQVKFPGYNKTLYTLCSPSVAFAVILVIVTAIAKIVYGEWGFAFASAVFSSMFIVLEVATLGEMSGHGVGVIKKERTTILGLPATIFMAYSSIICLIVLLMLVSFFTEMSMVISKATFLVIALLFSYMMSIATWRLHTYYKVWYGSEDDARLEFRSKHYSDEIVVGKIMKLKELGILR